MADARAEGKKLFGTHENVAVVRLLFDGEVGWIAVIRSSEAAGCSGLLGVSRGEKKQKNEFEKKR